MFKDDGHATVIPIEICEQVKVEMDNLNKPFTSFYEDDLEEDMAKELAGGSG